MLSKINRTNVYEVLSELMKTPTEETFVVLANGSVDKELDKYLSNLKYPIKFSLQTKASSYTSHQEIKNDYYYLFDKTAHIQASPPVESLYRVWTEDKSAKVPWAHEKGYLMADSALHIQNIFKELGMSLPTEHSNTPDHLAIELELMAHLVAEQPPDFQTDFIENHFSWLPDLIRDVKKRDERGLYTCILTLIHDFVTRELKGLTTKG